MHDTYKPRTHWSAWLVLALLACGLLISIGKLIYDNGTSRGYQEGKADASIEESLNNPYTDDNYFKGIMSRCIANGGIPYDLDSSKTLNQVCYCANTEIKQRAMTEGKSLADYHMNYLSAEQEKEIYLSCL